MKKVKEFIIKYDNYIFSASMMISFLVFAGVILFNNDIFVVRLAGGITAVLGALFSVMYGAFIPKYFKLRAKQIKYEFMHLEIMNKMPELISAFSQLRSSNIQVPVNMGVKSLVERLKETDTVMILQIDHKEGFWYFNICGNSIRIEQAAAVIDDAKMCMWNSASSGKSRLLVCNGDKIAN